MTLLKKDFLPLLGVFFLISTTVPSIYGLNCYSCSSSEGCAKNIQRITCKESEISCETILDKTNAIISMSCAETCDADANCCSSDLCNMIVAFDATAAADATTSKEATEITTKSNDETTKDASSDTTAPPSEGSSETIKSSSESPSTTTLAPSTTPKPHTNSGTSLTKTVFGIVLGIILSLLSIF